MPELPEVQTVVNDLQTIVGQKITGFLTLWPKAVKKIAVQKLTKQLVGQKVVSIERIGKNIFLTLSNKMVLGIHLKMTGQLLLLPNMSAKSQTEISKNIPKHYHHLFFLEKNKAMAFADVRKFGTITLYSPTEVALLQEKLGLDPMHKNFSEKLLSAALSKKPHWPIKQTLMAQEIIVGIGNIYASEILFAAKILPYRQTETLSKQELHLLFLQIKKVLKKAIALRGTSVSDYRDASGQKGQFQNHLRVYKKNTQKCQVCATIVAKLTIAGRSSFYCPNCQK